MGEVGIPGEEPKLEESSHSDSWRVAKLSFITILWVVALMCAWGAFEDPGSRLIVLFTWPFALWFLIAVHEFGHAIATWLVGWRVVAIAMGPIGYHFHNRDFAFVRRSKRTEFAGFVLPMPTRLETWTITRKNIISAGGPAANISLATAFFVAGWMASGPRAEDSVNYPLIYLGMAFGSLSLGIGALLPSIQRNFTSDGDHIRQTMRLTSAEWIKDRAIAYLAGGLQFQLRLRDLPRWMLEEASRVAAKDSGDFRQFYHTLEIGIMLDMMPVDITQTRAMVDDYRAQYGPSEWLNSCDAYLAAVWEGNGAKARCLLWRRPCNEELLALTLAAEAAVLAREGKVAQAREFLHEMREANRKKSIFPDHTFREIGRQIEAILPS